MDPLQEYSARRDNWAAREALFQKQFIRIGNWRLLTAILAAILAWFAFGRGAVSGSILLFPLAVFIALVVWHQNVIRRRTLAQRAIRFYDDGLARLNPIWMGHGIAGESFRDPSHVYSEDLDLFGKGSLFELLARTRTRSGEDMLASWLLAPAAREEALARQEAVRELRPNLELREDIALLGEDIRSEVNTEAATKWGRAPEIRFPRALRPLSLILAVGGIATLLAFFAKALPISPFAAILACDFAVIFLLRGRVSQVLAGVEASGRDLTIISLLVKRLEKESFESPCLQQLWAALQTDGQPASRRIAKLGRLVDILDSSDHVLVRAIRPVLLWNEQLAMALEAWRRDSGAQIGSWLHAISEFEALSSLAALAFERPQWCFPTLVESSSGSFHAEALQHPLMSPSRCVPNDVSFGNGATLLIVSGSNMSGKSTLLRAAGLNTILAWAGSCVAAARLETSPLQVAASIRVTDSLQENRSRFFAEITRIRQIVDLTRSGPPVLFLLDELLSGTNSHDRRIGAAGIVRGLLQTGAIGFVTTHDLALTGIEEYDHSHVRNVHFEDRIVEGRIEFDYKLKPGVVQRSNALELMRAVGLEV
ncbi:MAG: mismatch repair protein [Acidobacteriaceae bacterium]|nr:mismatch repair protein [Acidobacteriaceae bacterium]